MSSAELLSVDDVFSITDPVAQREAARTVVKREAEWALATPAVRSRVAYQLAGLLASPALAELGDDDPLKVVLNMLGELELPRRHQSAGVSWQRLGELLIQL